MRKQFLIISFIIINSFLFIPNSNCFSQAFNKVQKQESGKEVTFNINKDKYSALFSVNTESRTPRITFSGKANMVYNSIIQDAKLEFEVFTHPKSKMAFLFINNYFDYSHGADIYIIDDGQISYIGKLNIAAYNRVGKNKMDYCNILQCISIVQTTSKTYISFENPLVVLNPGQHDEQIIEGNKIHYTIDTGKLIHHISE